jgi:hypothetical protein
MEAEKLPIRINLRGTRLRSGRHDGRRLHAGKRGNGCHKHQTTPRHTCRFTSKVLQKPYRITGSLAKSLHVF